MSRAGKRSTDDYLRSAKAMSAFAPSLRKYRRRKTLKPQEKSAITRKEKILRTAYNLRPVNKRMARELKETLYAPGIQAIQFNNVSPTAKIRRVKKHIYIESNGRTWVYWKLPDVKKQSSMAKGAKTVFTTPLNETFDIERLEKLAKRAFENPRVLQVHLWTKQGRVGDGFEDLQQFMRWLYKKWGEYQNTELWVNGIAFLIE